MSIIKLPQIDSRVRDVTILSWSRREGESVARGDILFRFECILGSGDAQAGVDGRLVRIFAPSGATIPTGAPLAIIQEGEEDVATEVKRTERSLNVPISRVETPNSSPMKPPMKARKEETRKMPTPEPGGPVTPILMPQAGNSMEEGTILSWKVKVGDHVKTGEILVEIETDKASMELEAEADGRIARLVAAEGDIVPVKQAIAYLADSDGDVDAYIACEGGTPGVETSRPAPASVAQAVPTAAAPPAGAVTPILMPQAGNSMEEGTILGWRVKPGDRVKAGDILVEIETDKASMELEAEIGGRIARLVAAEGDIVAVKSPIAYMADNDADIDAYIAAGGTGASPAQPSSPSPVSAPPAPSSVAVPAAVISGVRPKASPAARKAASETGIDLKTVPLGSGPGGRILSTDLPARASADRVKASPAARKIAAKLGVDLARVGVGSGPGGRILSTDIEHAAASGVTPVAPAPIAVEPPRVVLGEPVRRPMSKMRRAIAKGLTFSKQNIPHFYMRVTIDADPMLAFYRREKARHAVSVNDAIIMACALSIQEFPAFRTQVDGNDLVEHPSSSIGVAVGTDEGLVVPVVMGVEQMSLAQLGLMSRRIVEEARNGKVKDQGKGVFTISNLGMFGVEEFSAIINPPEAAILAVGGVREEIIVRDGTMRPGRVMTMTLSLDHRVVDGLVAAKFAARLKEILEAPGDHLV